MNVILKLVKVSEEFFYDCVVNSKVMNVVMMLKLMLEKVSFRLGCYMVFSIW